MSCRKHPTASIQRSRSPLSPCSLKLHAVHQCMALPCLLVVAQFGEIGISSAPLDMWSTYSTLQVCNLENLLRKHVYCIHSLPQANPGRACHRLLQEFQSRGSLSSHRRHSWQYTQTMSPIRSTCIVECHLHRAECSSLHHGTVHHRSWQASRCCDADTSDLLGSGILPSSHPIRRRRNPRDHCRFFHTSWSPIENRCTGCHHNCSPAAPYDVAHTAVCTLALTTPTTH